MKKLNLLLLLLFPVLAFSQSNNAPSDFEPHELRITGYYQVQFQKASAAGIPTFAGGDFNADTDNRFRIRRGRFKLDRVDSLTHIVFQLDATQDGVSLRDAFIQLKDPFTKSLLITAGQFTKPFGSILDYSSSDREVPERPRVFQTIFPSERDLGTMVTIHNKKLPWLRYEVGVFNGSGTNARDYDRRKDLSMHLNLMFGEKTAWLFGGSYYNGFVRERTGSRYLSSEGGYTKQSAADISGSFASRRYWGLHLNLTTDGRLGKTSFKTEYVAGSQPGIAPSATVKPHMASRSFSASPTDDLYHREFTGYFFWLVKDIPGTKWQAMASFDEYDPADHVSGSTIGLPGNFTTAADIRYRTWGLGLLYHYTPQMKFTFFFDRPVNENTSLSEFSSDQSDNVFTLRAQYKF